MSNHNHPCHEPEDYIYYEFVEPIEDVVIDEDDAVQTDMQERIDGYYDEDGEFVPPPSDGWRF